MKDDWDLAIRYRDIQRIGNLTEKQKIEQSEKAIHSIINRAHEMLGPVTPPYRYLVSGEPNESSSFDIEETISENLGKVNSRGKSKTSDWNLVFSNRELIHPGLVLLLDTSLSMKGEKLAFLAMTVATVALSVPPETLCVLGFDTVVHELKNFDMNSNAHSLPLDKLVEAVLSIPPGGFTNMEKGLKSAREHIEKSNFPRARMIIISDGKYTEGQDPSVTVKDWSFGGYVVNTVKIGKEPTGRNVMKEIAEATSGHFHEVREMAQLPKVLLSAVRAWVK